MIDHVLYYHFVLDVCLRYRYHGYAVFDYLDDGHVFHQQARQVVLPLKNSLQSPTFKKSKLFNDSNFWGFFF